jgi:tetratricopeptide (TPR) repeat protein
MGAVYRAWHTLMDKALAFKVLHPEFGGQAQLAQRFQQEAQSTSRLDHPGVVRIHDFGRTEDGLLFLVMEHLEGRPLTDVLEQGALPVPRALDIAQQIALALDHAHGQGIVHRDLKPDNVMLLDVPEGRDRIKLLDFGIAKVLQGDSAASNLTQAGAIFGTPSYMAPEQAAGDAVDHRADLYALGVMLFEMLAGTKPFEGESNAQLIVKHISEPVPSLRQAAPGLAVPPALEGLVTRLLAKSPDERFSDAREVHRALMSVQPERSFAGAPHRDPSSSVEAAPAAPGAAPAAPGAAPAAPGAAPAAPGAAPAAPGAAPHATGAAPRVTGATPRVTGATPRATSGYSSTVGASRHTAGPLTGPVAVPSTPEAEAARRRRRWIIGGSVGGGVVLLLLILVLSISGSSEPGSGDRAATARIRHVKGLLAKGKVDEALVEIKTLVNRYPEDGRVHLLEAHACQRKKRRRECLASYEQAVRLRPESRADKPLLRLLYELLTYRRASRETNTAYQQAAQAFLKKHYRDGSRDSAAAAPMLTRYANKWRDPRGVWLAIEILRQHAAAEGVDLVRAHGLRLASVKGCMMRRAFIQQIVATRDRAFIPLLQKVIRRRSFRAPHGDHTVKNACIREDAKQAILALGGSQKDIPRSRPRRRSGGTLQRVGRSIERIFE